MVREGFQSSLPPGCAQDSQRRAVPFSYGFRLGKDFAPECIGQGAGGQHIDRYPQQVLQFHLNGRDVHEGGLGGGIDQEVQVAG